MHYYKIVYTVSFSREQKTVNHCWHCTLSDKVMVAYKFIIDSPICNVIFLYNNNRLHTAAITLDKITEMH